MKIISFDGVEDKREYKKPEAGAYICRITKVRDVKLNEDTGKGDYLKIWYDIDDGEFKGYYNVLREKYGIKDEDDDWLGVYTASYKKSMLHMFKEFRNAINASNSGYIFDPEGTNPDEQTLVGKRVGLVFRDEEYNSNMGEVKTRLKVAWPCAVADVKKQTVPKPKLLPKDTPTVGNASDLFVSTGIDEELPFA